jgi:hypothetical protein
MVGSHTLPPPTSSIKSIKFIKAHGHGQALHTCEYNEVRGVGTFYQIVSADLTAPHLQSVDPHVAVRPAEQIWITERLLS